MCSWPVLSGSLPPPLLHVLLALPVVHVGAADVRDRDLDDERAGFRIRHRVLADLEALAQPHPRGQPAGLSHGGRSFGLRVSRDRRPVYIVARSGDPRHSGPSDPPPVASPSVSLARTRRAESRQPSKSRIPRSRIDRRGRSSKARRRRFRTSSAHLSPQARVVGLQPPDVPGSLPMGVAARVDDQCRSALHRLGQRVVAAVTDHDVRGRVNGPEIAPLLRQPHATGGVHRPGGRDRLPGCGRPAHQIELNVAEFSKRAACNPESGPGHRSPSRPSTRSSDPAGPGRVACGPPRSWRRNREGYIPDVATPEPGGVFKAEVLVDESRPPIAGDQHLVKQFPHVRDPQAMQGADAVVPRGRAQHQDLPGPRLPEDLAKLVEHPRRPMIDHDDVGTKLRTSPSRNPCRAARAPAGRAPAARG